MSQMGLHDPFGHLKHKLWPKERMGVKLTIWFVTTKSQESPKFPYVKVMCNIPLESSQQGLQICFKPHLNWRFAHKFMGPQGCKNPNFGTPRKNDIWVLVPWPYTEYIIRGKVMASPKSGLWWVLWGRVCSWFVRAPKCSNYVLTNLLFGLCRTMWVIELLVNIPSPISEL
jgi:hypothetical protein